MGAAAINAPAQARASVAPLETHASTTPRAAPLIEHARQNAAAQVSNALEIIAVQPPRRVGTRAALPERAASVAPAARLASCAGAPVARVNIHASVINAVPIPRPAEQPAAATTRLASAINAAPTIAPALAFVAPKAKGAAMASAAPSPAPATSSVAIVVRSVSTRYPISAAPKRELAATVAASLVRHVSEMPAAPLLMPAGRDAASQARPALVTSACRRRKKKFRLALDSRDLRDETPHPWGAQLGKDVDATERARLEPEADHSKLPGTPATGGRRRGGRPAVTGREAVAGTRAWRYLTFFGLAALLALLSLRVHRRPSGSRRRGPCWRAAAAIIAKSGPPLSPLQALAPGSR